MVGNSGVGQFRHREIGTEKSASGKSKLTGIWKHCPRRVHSRPSQTYEELPLGRYALGRRELLGDTSWQPNFLFYMGYPTLTARASPRRSIETVVI